jgi:hypothetical protein
MQLKNRNLLRSIRLILAIVISMEAIYSKTWWLLIPVVIILTQAILNTGCTLNSCVINTNKEQKNKDVQYEELGKQ